MKTSSMLALALALAGAGAYAQPTAQGTAPPGAEEPDGQRAAIKFHNVDAEVVATDADKMTFTFKVGGEEKTAPVSVLAKHRLKQVKSGEKVKVGCKDVGGQHKEVVSIRPAGAAAAKE